MTDAGSEFTSAEFQRMLPRSKIHHTLKGGPEDIATLDRAIGTLRATLSRRVAHGGAWFEELDAAVKSINQSEHAAPFLEEPAEVEHNDDLRFDLRYKNVEVAKQNAQLAKQRADKLEKEGAFRVFEKTNFRKRAGQPNWGDAIHTVASISQSTVVDTQGKSFLTKLVRAVPSATEHVAAPALAKGGSVKVDDRRRVALQRFEQPMVDFSRRAGTDGTTIHKLGKYMAGREGFAVALRDQRATLSQTVELFSSIRRDGDVLHVSSTQSVVGPLDAFRRLRRISS